MCVKLVCSKFRIELHLCLPHSKEMPACSRCHYLPQELDLLAPVGFLPQCLFQIAADFFIALTFYMHIFQGLDSNLCLALSIASCQDAPSILKLLHSPMLTYSHLCYDHIKYFTSTYFKINNFIGLSYVRMTHFDPHSVFSCTELCQAVSWHITRSKMNQSVCLFNNAVSNSDNAASSGSMICG